jgi:hypothetical protein
MLPLGPRSESEIVTEAVNKLLSSRVSTPADYFHMYMTPEENMLWPNIRSFVRDVELQVRLTTN